MQVLDNRIACQDNHRSLFVGYGIFLRGETPHRPGLFREKWKERGYPRTINKTASGKREEGDYNPLRVHLTKCLRVSGLMGLFGRISLAPVFITSESL